MNHYPKHIGDWAKKTAHLSLLEKGIYGALLDWYYDEEAPLPCDKKKIYRKIGARTKPEQEATNAILDEFFLLQDNAWHQNRADEEIKSFKEGEPERDAKKENDKERQRRSRDRRKSLFDILRQHNIIPPYDTKTPALEALLSGVKSKIVTVTVTPVTCDNTANQNQNQNQNHVVPITVTAPPQKTPDNPVDLVKGIIALYCEILGRDNPLAPWTLQNEIGRLPGWHPPTADLSWWRTYWEVVRDDDFLMRPATGKPAGFKYLVSQACIAKVRELSQLGAES